MNDTSVLKERNLKSFKELFLDVISASEFVHGDFLDWERRLLTSGESFNQKLKLFFTSYFSTFKLTGKIFHDLKSVFSTSLKSN